MIGAAICASIFTTAVPGTWILANKLNSIDSNQHHLSQSIDRLALVIEEVRANSYTLARASEVALRQAIASPGMSVIDPRDPNKTIVVHTSGTP